MISWLLDKLNLINVDKYYLLNIKLNETLIRLTNISKTLKRVVAENEKKDKKIAKLENRLLIYEDTNNWYLRYGKNLSILTSALLKEKEKNEKNNK